MTKNAYKKAPDSRAFICYFDLVVFGLQVFRIKKLYQNEKTLRRICRTDDRFDRQFKMNIWPDRLRTVTSAGKQEKKIF